MQKEAGTKMIDDLLSKECLCIGLSNAAPVEYKEPFLKKLDAVTICPGPNISNFSKVSSLVEMTDHIYGRKSLELKQSRPHMFVRELQLYVSYLNEEIKESFSPNGKMLKNWNSFLSSLNTGVSYYKELCEKNLIGEKEKFLTGLGEAEAGVQKLFQKVEDLLSLYRKRRKQKPKNPLNF
jgi:hypothetical protein